jgi:hypothetical protein
MAKRDVAARVAALDWAAIGSALDEQGYAVTPPLLDAAECAALARLYPDASRFRTVVDMARYRFGFGEYRYFAAPLPPLVAALRAATYRRLAPIANSWAERLGASQRYPPRLGSWLARCAAAGQRRPTPLLLRYTVGGYNCLHQDLYGALAFPLQLTCMLSRPETDFTGGEFLVVEQRPRAQSRGEAIVLARGQAVIFAGSRRPVRGARGDHAVTLRHGVSRVRSGERITLGVIFHDAT